MCVFARLCLESRYLERNSVGRNNILEKCLSFFFSFQCNAKRLKQSENTFYGYMFVQTQTFKCYTFSSLSPVSLQCFNPSVYLIAMIGILNKSMSFSVSIQYFCFVYNIHSHINSKIDIQYKSMCSIYRIHSSYVTSYVRLDKKHLFIGMRKA